MLFFFLFSQFVSKALKIDICVSWIKNQLICLDSLAQNLSRRKFLGKESHQYRFRAAVGFSKKLADLILHSKRYMYPQTKGIDFTC